MKHLRGAGLVELLVALLLAAIAMAGALATLGQGQRAWRDAERMARLHERAQYVFATLEPELQMAGYFGANLQPQVHPAGNFAALASCGRGTVLPLRPAAQVIENGWVLSCSPQGRGMKPGTDILILHRASARITPDLGALQLRDNPQHPEGRDLLVRIYYVSNGADGDPLTPALRVKSLTAVAGEPAFIDTEVMPGVEDLQVELLPDDSAPRSVHVRLRLRPDADEAVPGDAVEFLAVDRRFNFRNAIS